MTITGFNENLMNLKLKQLTALVTRPEPYGSELCKLINAQGDEGINFPTIAFKPAPDPIEFEQCIKKLGEQDWLIFISQQAVCVSVPFIRKCWPQFPPQIKIAAIGGKTAQALTRFGYLVQAQPTSDSNSEIFLSLSAFQDVNGKKIAIFRGLGGRELIDQTLSERGAHVLPIIAYERSLPEIDVGPYIRLVKSKKIHVIVCTSFEGVQNLKELLFKTWSTLKNIPLIVVSERIKKLAHDLGFRTIWVATSARHDDIMKTLAQIRKEL